MYSCRSGSQSADPHELVERARLTQLKVDLLNTKQALKEVGVLLRQFSENTCLLPVVQAKEEKAKYEQDLTVLRRRNEAGEALLVAQLKEIREVGYCARLSTPHTNNTVFHRVLLQ